MKKILASFLVISLFAAGRASATEYAIMGFGVASCATFGQDYARFPDAMEPAYFNWAQGFMSGLNAAALADKNSTIRDLNAKPVSSQEFDIRQYCDAHPLQSYERAVYALYYSLRKISN